MLFCKSTILHFAHYLSQLASRKVKECLFNKSGTSKLLCWWTEVVNPLLLLSLDGRRVVLWIRCSVIWFLFGRGYSDDLTRFNCSNSRQITDPSQRSTLFIFNWRNNRIDGESMLLLVVQGVNNAPSPFLTFEQMNKLNFRVRLCDHNR